MIRVVFRADASNHMGVGHVMRCLSLARELKSRGCCVTFLTRNLEGNLISSISEQGFELKVLGHPRSEERVLSGDNERWLQVKAEREKEESKVWVSKLKPDILIVDHYGIDETWESTIGQFAKVVLVIEDAPTRRHCCDFLVDQTLNRKAAEYRELVPQGCVLLTGCRYALLRPDFSRLRALSLSKRDNRRYEHILVMFGGHDFENLSGQFLEAMLQQRLEKSFRISIVAGIGAPFLGQLESLARRMPMQVKIYEFINDIAKFCVDVDLAIGAAGSSCWERCVLGIPSLILVKASNQREIAQMLANEGAALVFEDVRSIVSFLKDEHVGQNLLHQMSQKSRRLVDGYGITRVSSELFRT